METSRQIGEKLAILLTDTQRQEVARHLLEYSGTSDGSIFNSYSAKYDWQKYKVLTEIQKGDLYLCLEQRCVISHNREIVLTAKEFDILFLLASNPGRVFTYELIMEIVWHEESTYYSRKAINNHVSNLRKKLKIEPDAPDYIKNVVGVGYKFALTGQDH